VDPLTGHVIETQKSKTRVGKSQKGVPRGPKPKGTHHVVLNGDGKQFTVPLGTNPADIPRTVWPYNQVTAELIADKVSEGLTLKQIGDLVGFPPTHTIKQWTMKHPEFKGLLNEARALRAEHFHDKVIEVAENCEYESDAAPSRVKIDAFKWAAKVGDPNVYGDKTKISGDPSAPLGFVFMTGVPDPEPPAIEAKGKTLPDAEEN
jgi:hypothetical protein